MALYTTTSKEDFAAKVTNSKKVVLVDFWAEWCPPCRMMAPVLDNLAKKYDDKLDVVKVDVEASNDNAALATEHRVQGIPNMQVYKDGKVVDTLIGMRPESVLLDELKSHFA